MRFVLCAGAIFRFACFVPVPAILNPETKIVQSRTDIYPILAFKTGRRGRPIGRYPARGAIVELQDTSPIDRVDARGWPMHIALPGKNTCRLGGSLMGAISNLKRQLSSGLVPSPAEKIYEVPPARKFMRVPTHAIGVAEDRRRCPRACLCLPLLLTSIDGRAEALPVTLVTKNISSTGIYFLAPRVIEPGTAIELEVALIERPLGRGSVRLRTAAHVVRIDICEVPGWNGFAASFDDIDFQRDDRIPLASEAH
jgi:hypothetical protein